MSENQKIVGIYFIDRQDKNHVVELDENTKVSYTEKAMIIDNVYIPFLFQKAIQPCDEKLFTELKQYL